MPKPIARPARLRADLDALRDAVDALRFDLAIESRGERIRRRDAVVGSISTHLDWRLSSMDAPLVVSLFGPTGSGKSTITNTLAGREISRSGVIRPTTREAVVWCHREHAGWVRASALADSGPIEVVEDDHPLLRGLVLVDTPDIDSIATEHRAQTERILLMSDAAIGVTTPQRYADAVPWDFLADLTARGMPLHVIMNRTRRRSSGAVGDLVSLLRSHGVGGVDSLDDVYTIQEQRVKADSRLAPSSVKRLAEALERMVADRARVIRQGVEGAIRRVIEQTQVLSTDVSTQDRELGARWAAVEEAYRSQADEVEYQLESGDLVKSEVVDRWRRLVGVGDLARIVTRGVTRLRDLVVPGAVDAKVEVMGREVREELTALTLHRVARARSIARTALDIDDAGRVLAEQLEGGDSLEIEEAASEAVDAWMADVVELVASQGKSRFRLARLASLGVNATATVLLLAVFASTGGITGGEVGVVAGTAAAQQTILEHLLGSASAARLASRARRDLVERIEAILWADAARFRVAFDSCGEPSGTSDRLQDVARQVEISVESAFDD